MTKEEKKERLGLGIRALLNTVDTPGTEIRKEVIKEASRTVNEIPLDWVELNPFQPRKDFDQGLLTPVRRATEQIKVRKGAPAVLLIYGIPLLVYAPEASPAELSAPLSFPFDRFPAAR